MEALRISLVGILVGLCFSLSSQYDFNNYKTLQSKGAIPADFLSDTYKKIENRIDSNDVEIKNDIDQRIFLENSMYSVDELLNSGYVVFGDEITTYVLEIVDILLRDNPEVKSKLRFYTIKSDETNAFSTDQGIIFVTTGLISQLENDAQLAYVLAHEISHYTQKHVVNTYSWSRKEDKGTHWINQLSQYSRENETEADILAVEMYKKAGFSLNHLDGIFDVLLYSYLPFDEIAISLDYFKSDQMFIPESLFPKIEFPIKSRENVKDDESTHPNIAKRRLAVQKKVTSLDEEWGSIVFVSSEEKFVEIRTIARFESLRTQVIDAEFGKALYSIFILEKDYPESIYLKRLKGQCWLSLYQYTKIGKRAKTLISKSDYEGESAKVHHMISQIDKKALMVMSLRTIYDLKLKYPKDNEILAIYKHICKELGTDNTFELNEFYKESFQDISKDSLIKVADSTLKNKDLTKYDRIKKTKNIDEFIGFDTTRYYLYGLHDVIKDQEFLDLFNKSKDEYIKAGKEKEELNRLSLNERKIYDRKHGNDKLKLGLSEFIIVQPKVISYTNQGVDNVRSEYLERTFQEAYSIASESSEKNIHMISDKQFVSGGIEVYNQRNALLTRLDQMRNEEKINSFPIDFTLTRELINQRGTSKVLFSVVDHTYDAEINLALLFTSICFPIIAPIVWPVHIPNKIISGNHTNIQLILFDVETGEILLQDSTYFNAPLNKYNLSAHLYIMFRNLENLPSN